MKIQVAYEVFITIMGITKKILSLLEFKLGKKSEDYKYAKKEVFNYTYRGLKDLFKLLETKYLIRPLTKSTISDVGVSG